MKKIATSLTLFSLFAGVLLTVWGLTHMQWQWQPQSKWPYALPWAGAEVFKRYVIFLVLCAVFVTGVSYWSKKSLIFAGVIVAFGIALLSGLLWPLFVALWFAFSAAISGKHALTLLHIKIEQDNWLTNFLVGAGVYGTVVGLLAHFPVNYPGVYGAALAFPLLLSRHVVINEGKNLISMVSQKSRWEGGFDKIGLGITVVALFLFCVALMPEIGCDALSMHLFVPSQLSLRHQWGFDPGLYAMGLIPQLGAWIYSIGYMLGGETASRLINVGFVFVLARLCYRLVCWAGGTERGGKWAALIFLSTPLTYTESSSLFIEAVWAAYVVAGVYWMFKLGSEEVDPGYSLKVAGILLGCACATKAVTLSNLPVLVTLLFYRWRTWLCNKNAFTAIEGLLLFFGFGAIPYVTSWVISHNPIFPFFNKIFKSPYYPLVNFDNPLFNSGVTWDLPYKLVFESGRYLEATNGASGFQWLLLLLPALILLGVQKNAKALLLFVVGVLFMAITFHSQSYLRYIFPTFVLLTAMIGVALSGVAAQGGILNVFSSVAALTVGVNLLFLTAGSWNYRDFPIGLLKSETARSDYLGGRMPIRRAVEFSNSINSSHEPVAFFSQGFAAGLNADALFTNWHNYRFSDAISAANDVASLVNVFSNYGVKLVLLDSSWGTKDKRRIIEEATNNIAVFGAVSVRSVRPEFLFLKELLKNPDLGSQEGWSFAPGAIFDPDLKTMTVSVSSNVSQAVAVQGGKRYLNKVSARCADQPTQGRVQVNWLDLQGQFITTNIVTFDCDSLWEEHSMEVTSPFNAVTAIVYISGNTSIPLEYKENSFRQ